MNPASGREHYPAPSLELGPAAQMRMSLVLAIGIFLTCAVARSDAQSRTGPETVRTLPVPMTCAAQLGNGARTGRLFCDVLIGRDPSSGVLLRLPKRDATATLVFDLHARHTYSADQERAGTAFARYTADVAIVSLDGKVLSRAVVRTEVRREADLYDRITGGAGPGGLKAVAPAGIETVAVEVPKGVDAVSILGEKLATATRDGEDTYSTPGRPVAVVSHPLVEIRADSSRPSRRSSRRP
jgi:hypothetical protein